MCSIFARKWSGVDLILQKVVFWQFFSFAEGGILTIFCGGGANESNSVSKLLRQEVEGLDHNRQKLLKLFPAEDLCYPHRLSLAKLAKLEKHRWDNTFVENTSHLSSPKPRKNMQKTKETDNNY